MRVRRGADVNFVVAFRESDGGAIEAEDPSAYPAYSAVDPDGVEIAAGVAREARLQPGVYNAKVLIPDNAQLTIPSGPKYVIEFYMISETGRQISKRQEFEVIADEFAFDADLTAYQYVTMYGYKERVRLVLDDTVEQVTLQIGDCEQPNILYAEFPKSKDKSIKEIHEERHGNYVEYYVDCPPTLFQKAHFYLLVWNTKTSWSSRPDRYLQFLECPNDFFWEFSMNLKQLADKLHKRAGLLQAVDESSMLMATKQGTDMVNGYNPLTMWNYWEVPGYFRTFLTSAALVWLFEAQIVMAGEGAANFSGQTVSIDYDPTGVYDAAISRHKDNLQRLEQLKRGWSYKRGVTHTAFRAPLRYMNRTSGMHASLGFFPWFRF